MPQPLAPLADHGRFRWGAIHGWVQAHPTRFLLLVFVGLAAALTLVFAVRGTLGAPPGRGDGPDYENIGFNLAQGRGYRFDWDNPEWRSLYEQHNSDHRYDYFMSRSGSWPTAPRRCHC